MLPAGEWLAEASRRAVSSQQTGSRHHSRAWWRRHRARLRRQHALAAERRRRRWTIRSRAASQSDTQARLSLHETLKPVELPGASPSSLASIATIEQQVSAPLMLAATPTQQTPAAPLTTATATTPTNANAATITHASATPRTAMTTAINAQTQIAPSPVLAHAPQQKPATDSNIKTLSSPSLAAKPVSNVAANVVPATSLLSSPLAPVPSPLARLAGSAPQAAAPLLKVAPPARSLVGSDPRKFSALPVPHNWLGVSATLGGEYKFSLRTSDGRQSGVAVWSRLNLPALATTDRRNRSLAGVAHASLRRTVIDRMVLEGGWVVNDFEREIAGQKVFVVVAQSESNGLRRAWTYYFVDLDGQLFSLATTAPSEFAGSVADEAEQTLSALASRRGAANVPHN
jgi:hypothetical protein